MESTTSIDIPTTIMALLALVTTLTASFFAWKFSSTVGGDIGGAFKWVMIGIIVFAITRVDDVLKVTGIFTGMGVDYQHTIWLPHSLAVFVAWVLIGIGFKKMDNAFAA